MYKLLYTEDALKRIAKLDERRKLQIKEAVEEIAKDPMQGKPLSSVLKGRYSYRSGDYRIIYRVHHREIVVLILTLGHRKDIYKYLKRKDW